MLEQKPGLSENSNLLLIMEKEGIGVAEYRLAEDNRCYLNSSNSLYSDLILNDEIDLKKTDLYSLIEILSRDIKTSQHFKNVEEGEERSFLYHPGKKTIQVKIRRLDSNTVYLLTDDITAATEEKKIRLVMQRINDTIFTSTDVRKMLRNVLSIMLDVFDCDRAWLLYPFDPEAESYELPLMVTKPNWTFEEGVKIPIDKSVAKAMGELVNTNIPVAIYANSSPSLSRIQIEKYNIKSQLVIPIKPSNGGLWLLGIQMCEYEKIWIDADIKLMGLISRRMRDGLNNLHYFKSLEEHKEQLLLDENVFANTIEALVITDQDGIIQRVNKTFTDITGYLDKEVMGQKLSVLRSDHQELGFFKEMLKIIHSTGKWSGEVWNRKKDGTIYPEWLTVSSIKNGEGKIVKLISLFHDISDRKTKDQQLNFLALYDSLTKLPNRNLFYDRVKIALLTAKRSGKKAALLYMDVDNFKNINDSYGHPFGDKVLCAITGRISEICRESDTIARHAGDEFAIILNNIKDNDEAIKFSKRVISLFKKPLAIKDEEIYTSVSIGLAIFPDDGEEIITLEKNADMALNKAKKEGRRRFSRFNKDLKTKLMRSAYLENELRKAARDYSSFFVLYQPKVNSRTRIIEGVEALLRWNLNGEIISPTEFIPIAEETGAILNLGDWVLRKAMEEIKNIHDSNFPEITLSVNLSTKQFDDEGLFISIQEALEKTEFNRERLCLEITESVPMGDSDRAIGIMNELSSMGIILSMDDFGTGYSSLNYLKRFPLHELKIDRSFITDILKETNDLAICNSIVNIANSLKFQVVAEGVETAEQYEIMQEIGCHMIQGYYFFKPLTSNELLEEMAKASRF